jgi:DoxX-like family/Protein of unknown function (DUF3419)
MTILARGAIALVWIYHGLWCKLLGECPEQAAIVAAVPGLAGGLGRGLFLALGLAETAIAGWVLGGRAPRAAALVQTTLILAMNGGGLLWGRAHIADPSALVVQNIAFLALVWVVAVPPQPPENDRAIDWAAGRFTGRRGPPRLLFGRMHEDWRIEAEAFPAGTRVFCIASAGCTALELAAGGREVVAVDVNPAQVAYLRERLAGAPCREGEADRRLGQARRLQPLVGWTGLWPFLEMEDPQEQVRFWDTRLDTWRLRAALGLALSGPMLHVVYRDAFVRALPSGFADELRQRFRRGFGRHPNRTNPYAWRLLRGRVLPEPESPRPAPGTVTLACAEAAAYLEGVPAGAFAGFALSNILDGASRAAADRLRAAVRHAGSGRAIAVLRSFAPAAKAADAEWAARDRALLWGSIRVVLAAEL